MKVYSLPGITELLTLVTVGMAHRFGANCKWRQDPRYSGQALIQCTSNHSAVPPPLLRWLSLLYGGGRTYVGSLLICWPWFRLCSAPGKEKGPMADGPAKDPSCFPVFALSYFLRTVGPIMTRNRGCQLKVEPEAEEGVRTKSEQQTRKTLIGSSS